jgi:hypothetical protein
MDKLSIELLMGESGISMPRIRAWEVITSLWNAHRVLQVYDSKGVVSAFSLLEDRRIRPSSSLDVKEQLLVAFVMSARVQLVLQVRRSGSLCLPRSLAVCAAVRHLGVPAQVVIGRRMALQDLEPFQKRYEFHAWCEFDGVVLTNDASDTAYQRELLRIPTY